MKAVAAGGSLRLRVLTLALSAVVLVWLGAAAYSYFDARHEANEILDGYLAQSAALIAAQATDGQDEIDVEHAPQLHKYARRVAFQVWEGGRELRLHSANAPNRRLMARDEGFADVVIDGRAWRAFSSWDRKHKLLIQVGEERGTRDAIAASVGRSLLTPLLVALPLLALLLWWAVTGGLRPLRELGEQVASRDSHNLAPLDAGTSPAEVAPLVGSLNHLFERVGQSLARERRFTADAAHELRTPIAALRTQAQVALGATTDAERAKALLKVVAGCDRAARLVDQMLTLARLDPAQPERQATPCNLAAILRASLADAAPNAIERAIDIELAADDGCVVSGDPALLAILARNLVDNAVRYGESGTHVRATVARDVGGVELRVADDGPGVPATEMDRLGERFYRQTGMEATGSGLGLSIVRRIADVHGATVAFRAATAGTGLVVTVRFADDERARAAPV
ncbi:MAG: ATP-binding protein [Betaproteobacteria bacterium]